MVVRSCLMLSLFTWPRRKPRKLLKLHHLQLVLLGETQYQGHTRPTMARQSYIEDAALEEVLTVVHLELSRWKSGTSSFGKARLHSALLKVGINWRQNFDQLEKNVTQLSCIIMTMSMCLRIAAIITVFMSAINVNMSCFHLLCVVIKTVN